MKTSDTFNGTNANVEESHKLPHNSQLPRLRTVNNALIFCLKRHDISAPMALVIMHIALDKKEYEPAILSDETHIPRQTMTSVLDALEKNGYLQRLPHPTDRRRKHLIATNLGVEKATEILVDIIEFEKELFSVLSPDEMRQFDIIAEKITAKATVMSNLCSEK